MLKDLKILQRLKLCFDSDLKNKVAKKNDIKEILKNLNYKKRHILLTISEENSVEEVNNLQMELDIIHAQRKKGIKIVKKMNHDYS